MNRALFFAAILAVAGQAQAAPLSVREAYALSIAGIEIGDATVTLASDGERYDVQVDGGYRFLFWSGAAKIESAGLMDGARLSPRRYRSTLVSSTREVTTAIEFDETGVAEADFRSEPPFDPEEFGDRTPVEDGDLIGAADPVSAFLIPAATAAGACGALLKIFSGVARFDLELAAGPVEESAAAEPAATPPDCRTTYRPIGGHRRESAEVDRLREHGLELALFEIAPGLWAPRRLGFRTRFGTLALERKAP